jgi:hypothetical protein
LEAVIATPGGRPQAAPGWQKAAQINETTVQAYVESAKAAGNEITVAGLLQWSRDDEDHGGEGGQDDEHDDPPTHECPLCGLVHHVLGEGSEA